MKRFWDKVNKTDNCWLWTAGTDNKYKYGRFWLNERMMLAHRVSYELTVGPIPDGLVLDHRCFNPSCVNPKHLEPVSVKKNIERRSGLNKNNTSGARGVHWDKSTNSWAVEVWHNRKKFCAGRYSTVDEAHRVAEAVRETLYNT
jgi:hypothetical protein